MRIVLDIPNLSDLRILSGVGGAVCHDMRDGNYIHCEQGVIRLVRGGGAACDHGGKQIKQYQRKDGSGHELNFVKAVRASDRSQLNAEINAGHLSTSICRQANIAFRVGREANGNEVRNSFGDHKDMTHTLETMVAQIERNGVNLSEKNFIASPKLRYDRKAERFIGQYADAANQFVTNSYLALFTLPANLRTIVIRQWHAAGDRRARDFRIGCRPSVHC